VQQQILRAHTDADVRVYVVWMPVLATDERFGVAEVMVDERVTQFWDNGQLVSDEVGRILGAGDVLAWDIGLVYGPGTHWEHRLPKPVETGAPVVAAIGSLEAALAPYLGASVEE
jgi:hypothetical protein